MSSKGDNIDLVFFHLASDYSYLIKSIIAF